MWEIKTRFLPTNIIRRSWNRENIAIWDSCSLWDWQMFFQWHCLATWKGSLNILCLVAVGKRNDSSNCPMIIFVLCVGPLGRF
jgi:hypothetical protein